MYASKFFNKIAMMLYKRMLFLLLVLVSYNSYSVTGNLAKDLKILFVGNSLTYTNNLPALVEEMATLDGKKITTHSIVFAKF